MKRIISFLLTLVMLVSLIPAAFAAEDSGVRVVYRLSDHMETLAYGSAVEYGASDDMNDLNGELTDGFYSFLPNEGVAGHYSKPASAVFGYGVISALKKRFVKFADNAKVSFEIVVPKAGTYAFEMYNYLSTEENLNGKYVNVYFSEDAISTADANKVGSYTCYTDDSAKNNTIPETPSNVGNIEIAKPGKYIVTFTTTSSRWFYNNIGTFVLNGGDATVPMLTEVSLSKDRINIGEDAEVSAVVEYMSDAETPAEGVTYSYATSDETIAKVDATGKITGVGMGIADITVTATKDGNSSSKAVGISVLATDAANIKLQYKFTGKDYAITWKEVATETAKGFAKLTYDVSHDLNQYYANNKNETGHNGANEQFRGYGHEGYGMDCSASGNWYAATIRVPVSGKYIASVGSAKYKYGSDLGVYLIKKDKELSVEELDAAIKSSSLVGSHNCRDTSYTSLVWLEEPVKLGIIDVAAGEYYLVFKNIAGSSYAWFGDFYLDGLGSGTAPLITDCTAEKTTFEIDETAAITTNVRYITDGNSAESVAYAYKSSAPSVAEVSTDGTITAKSEGNATITVTATAANATLAGTRTIDIKVNSKEDKAIADAFKTTETAESYAPSVTAYVYKDGKATILENTATETYVRDNGDGTYKLSAPDADDGYKFLYWVKGLSNTKKILGTSNEITYRATKDKSIIVAVYENSSDESAAKAEFYNANMQLISANSTFELPELPVLAGFGKALAWVSDDMTEYTSGKAEAKKNGTTVFVAKYEEEPSEIAITATNATVDNAKPAYGDKITVTAKADAEGSIFQYFTKNGEIVCLDRTYSFNAYKSCEVVAVYGASAPVYTGNRRKIFFDTFDVSGKTGLMAEFIGFSSGEVVEKGIMFGTNKIPMTTDKTQFAIIADEEGTYKGYAIIKNGETYILITDGEYTE